MRHSSIVRRLIRYVVPAVFSALVIVFAIWIGITELALAAGFTAVGYFAVAFLFYSGLSMIPQSIMIPLIPEVSRLSVVDPEGLRIVAVRILRSASVLLFPIAFAVAMLSEHIVNLLYGSSYLGADRTVFLMAWASFFYAMAAIVGAMIAGLGRMWLVLALNSIWAGSFVVLVFAIIPSFGVEGLGVTFAGSLGVHVVASFVLTRKKLHIDFRGAYAGTVVAAALFLFGYAAKLTAVGMSLSGETLILFFGILAFLCAERTMTIRFWNRFSVLISTLRNGRL